MFLLVNEDLFCIRQKDSSLRKIDFFSYFKSKEKRKKPGKKFLYPMV